MHSSTVSRWRLAGPTCAFWRSWPFQPPSHHRRGHGRPYAGIPELFHKLVAKHQNVLRGRRENLWASEATSVVELVGTDDILAKMTYALTNPVKDGLIDRADQWPGATSL